MKSPLQALPTRRFWVVVFALVSLGIMAGGLKYYQYEQDHIRREKYQELAAIADLKVRQILEWRRERIEDARSMARDPFLGKAIAEWLRDPGNPGLRAPLLERLKVEKEGWAYGNVLLADPDGRILLSVRPDPAPLSPAGKRPLEAAVAGRQAVVGDLFRCPKDHRVHLDVAAAVLDPRGQPLAVVVLRTNADEVLYPLIQSWPTPSRTAETLLVQVDGKDVLFLNELRHREKTALSLREPLTQKDLPAVQAGLGKQGVFEGRDYRGKKVLADLRPVPQSAWFMVAKVDADEVMAEVRYRAGITGLFVVIFILLTAAVTAYSHRQRQANLYQDLYQSEREQRQAQEEFRTTLYSIGDAVITTDTEGLVKHINPVAERLTGWLEAEARGKPLEEVFRIINEETRTAVENPAQRVLREGVVLGLANHTLLIARDGTESPIADSGAPIRDENGAVIGVVLVFRDQTEERAVQNALRESEEHYRSLFDNMLNGFAYCKMLFEQNQPQDFIYLNVNSSFEILTGLKNVVGKRVSEVIPGIRESDPELFETYGRVALTGKPERLETYVEALKMWFSISVYSPEKEYFVAVFDIVTERKQAEESLRNQMQLTETLLETIPSPVFYKDTSGRYLGCNRAFEEFWGKRREAVIGKDVYEMGPKEIADKYAEMDQELFERPGSQMYEWKVMAADGLGKDVIFYKASLLDAGGKVAGLIGVILDITERKRAEENLRQTRDYLDNLINHANAPIIVWDPSFRITRFNRAFENLTGYSAQEVVGQKLDLLFPEASCEESLSKIARTSSGEYWEAMEIPILHKDGDIRIALWNSANIHAEDGAILVATIAQGQDITERKRAEEAFQVLVNHAPMGIFIIQDGKCQIVNPGFEQVTGYTAQELLGHDSRNLVHPDYREMVRESAIRMVKGKLDLAYEFPIITKSGETKWVIEKVTSTMYQGKRATLGYFIDISEHKSLEDQFLQAQKMEAVGTLAGGIAHDFNNILTAILGNIGLAALDDKIGPRVKDRLAQAEAACWRAQALSQQLLTFAKGGAPVKQLFSVAELLTESTAFTCVGSSVKCETTLPENLWWVEADPGQIGQVFQNLTINAIQAMPAGGTIKVWAENLTLGTDSSLPLGTGRYIKISLRDQGIGIQEEHLLRIFDPYFTTKQKGSGLGLASTYAIVEKHHGHIAVESKPGVGTTFTIYLPAVERQVSPQPEEDRELLVGKGKILVMDDEEMVREVLGRMLVRLGYEAEFARDGGEAIEMFVQAQGSGQAFAAVILDLTVPGGIGGKETMARLLEIDPQVKAIVSSGYSDDPIMADFQKYGFSGFIAKPYRISELGKILNQVIMKKA